jgi:hypothetical protein
MYSFMYLIFDPMVLGLGLEAKSSSKQYEYCPTKILHLQWCNSGNGAEDGVRKRGGDGGVI